MCIFHTTIERQPVMVEYHVYRFEQDDETLTECDIVAVLFEGVNVLPILTEQQLFDLETDCIDAWIEEGRSIRAEHAFEMWQENNEM